MSERADTPGGRGSERPEIPEPSSGGKPTTLLPEGARPGLFEAYGVEIESMIVDAATLDVKPVCDRLMAGVSGEAQSEVERGDLAWSNELVLHVLELKTNGPARTLVGLSEAFHASMLEADAALEPLGARLLPGAVHPWMDPFTETLLWPHEYTEVYHTFDRIFGCSGHGWANLQSTHLNLPFSNDEEFGRLHAAVRIVLPLIPALTAASPYLGGVRSPHLDARLAAYRVNARRVPSVTGLVVPEPAFTHDEYERTILGPIYRDLEAHDPDGVLRHEWANARGAIARFDRGAVEIRVIDAQECPAADLAVLAAITSVVRALTDGPLAGRDRAADPGTEELAAVLDGTITLADQAPVGSDELKRVLGLGGSVRSAGDAWRALMDAHPPADWDPAWGPPLEAILGQGPLARRMVARAGEAPTRPDLETLAHGMGQALRENAPLEGAG